MEYDQNEMSMLKLPSGRVNTVLKSVQTKFMFTQYLLLSTISDINAHEYVLTKNQGPIRDPKIKNFDDICIPHLSLELPNL